MSEQATTPTPVSGQKSFKLSAPRKVLLIYSLDHPLYKDIVLKLCAFLRAKCATEVVLDLLDSTRLGAVGRMQWLDWQKQQIEKSSDKILFLCSRGVRAKWRAMCGEGRVMLREDLRSPMGDMLTPALNLIIPDVVHCTSFQKYIVAYFEEVSSEEDVPAPFNVTIKYKLMMHFEELYFRILDQEKHEPGRVNRIEGIAPDDYFNCPSGRALRDAIETLQAFQLENQDWFEKECVDCEKEVAESELQPLLADICRNPMFQCASEFQEGPPVLVNEVQFSEDAREVDPLMSKWNLQPFENEGQPCSRKDAAPREPAVRTRNIFNLPRQVSCRKSFPAENRDEAWTPTGHLSPTMLRQLQALRRSLCFAGDIAPMSLEVAACQKRPHSGSDQGYISRISHHQDSMHNKFQNALDTLTGLQEACLFNSVEPPGDVPTSDLSDMTGNDRAAM